MRDLYDKVRLSRTKSHRKALFSNLSAALFLHKRITTTLAKAKYARRFAERLITFARKGDVAARRHVLRFVRNKGAVKELFDNLGPHFKHRNGGYTRIIKLGPRSGDAAPMAILELVGFDDVSTVAVPKKETKSKLRAAQRVTADERRAEEKVTPKTKVEEKMEKDDTAEQVAEDVETPPEAEPAEAEAETDKQTNSTNDEDEDNSVSDGDKEDEADEADEAKDAGH